MAQLTLLLIFQAIAVLGLINQKRSQHSLASESFETLSAEYRPRFRYWLPDAGVDPKIVAADIKDSGEHGAGGVEFVPFYNYGGESGGPPSQVDWAVNGFGTPAFRNVFRAALQAHKDSNLLMDFAIGPNQGQGVPASSDDDGLQWDLIPYSEDIALNETFYGKIPGWGAGELVAVVSANVLSQTNVSLPKIESPFLTAQAEYLSVVLNHESLCDITDRVSKDGHLSLSFPVHGEGIGNRIFAFYQRRTLNRNVELTNNATNTIWDNGSYVVDHYSARGAQTVIEFWEKHILIDGIKELLMEVGHYAWEDSMEIKSNTSWTPSLPDKFEQKLGYSILRYLPVINFGILWPDNNINIQRYQPGAVQSILDTPDSGAGFINDFRGVLEDCYREYLQALTDWTHKKLNLEYSAQVSYNLPMGMEVNIPIVDVPECESLQFDDSVDAYRQFSGPAILAGQKIISNEMGAITGAYGYKFSNLIFSVGRAIVGGVNQLILHGQSYTGNYPETTWPGYTAFSYTTTELYSKKQPSWDHGLSDVLKFFTRVQYTQRQGVPRVDVAIYNKASATNSVEFPSIHKSNDLIDEGWSWAYLSPDNFILPEASVKNNVLGPHGPCFKALVVTSDNNMTLTGVRKIQTYASSGLPIVFSGGLPGIYASGNGSELAAIKTTLKMLSTSANVYTVNEGDVSEKLLSLGLLPNIQVETDGKWLTTWREDASNGVDYALIFCDSNLSSGYVTVTGLAKQKVPYFLNAWTGDQEPVFAYSRTPLGLRFPISLNGNQTLIIKFISHESSNLKHPNLHAIAAPKPVVGSKFEPGRGWVAHVTSQNPDEISRRIQLSNGKYFELPQKEQVADTFNLTKWRLVAEHWEAPEDLYDAKTVARKHNTTHELPSLISWSKIPALTNTSGLGYYSTSFQWPPLEQPGSAKKADGAYIYFPSILHAVQVSINGQRIPPLDYTNARADISPYIRRGENEVLAVVPTTMWNYIRSILSDIRDQGRLPGLLDMGLPVPEISDNGLIEEVSIIPYRNLVIPHS